LPLDLPNDQDFPILQYADDTLIFLQGSTNQLLFLKVVLNTFAKPNGLKVNYEKSMLVPINVDDNHLNILANTFASAVGSLPFTYLGLPLSLSKPTLANFWPLVSKCERRMISISSFLSEAGRLQLTNVVLTALPTFSVCTFLLPRTVIKQIDKFRKHCLWRGSNLNSKKPPKEAWDLVYDSKENGVLGVINLQTQNGSLLLKHFHKFFNKLDVPWVNLIWHQHYGNGFKHIAPRKCSFWWRDILKLLDSYKGIAFAMITDGPLLDRLMEW